MANYFKPKPKAHQIGQQISLTIEKLNDNAHGVGQFKNKPIFVMGALPNEQVDVKVIEQKSKFLRGKLIKVIKEVPERSVPQCRYFYSCGGCDLQHINFEEHLKIKQTRLEHLLSRQGVLTSAESNLPWQQPITSEPWHYRRKARIGVQYNKKGEAIVGFRQKGTNQLVDIKKCVVLTSPLSDIFVALKETIDKLTLSKSIGHIEVIDTDSVTVVIRQLKALNSQDSQLWLLAAQSHQWNIIIDDGKTLEPLNNSTEQSPPDLLSYPLPQSLVLQFPVQSFIQVNQAVNEKMILQALAWLELKADDMVLDLFCGLGNFSLPIAQQVKQVVGVEGVQSMVVQAQKNAQYNQLENCQFYQADLNSDWHDAQWTQIKYNKVLLDPARAGAEEALQTLVKFNISSVLYVSCDPETLARDIKYLIDHGYKIQKIALMDMFSQTKHIETMVLFNL